MSVRQGLLALLTSGPAHGYLLKVDYEAVMRPESALNVGQVYTTLARLERDGLVGEAGGDERRRVYAITDTGRRELHHWLVDEVEGEPEGGEIVARVLLGSIAQGEDLVAVLDAQRHALLEALARIRREQQNTDDARVALGLDARGLHFEALARWIDRVEARRTELEVGLRPEEASR